MTQIFCFGDSITFGRWDEEGGWVQRLRRELDNRSIQNTDEEDFQVWNMGVPGDDTCDLLERFEEELKRRKWDETDQIIIFQIGINDTQYIRDEDCIRVSKGEFKDNIEELMKRSEDYSSKVIFIGLANTDVGKIPWAPQKVINNERADEYNEILEKICKREAKKLIDFREDYDRSNWCKYLQDGLHPNSEGHQKIKCRVKEELNTMEVL